MLLKHFVQDFNMNRWLSFATNTISLAAKTVIEKTVPIIAPSSKDTTDSDDFSKYIAQQWKDSGLDDEHDGENELTLFHSLNIIDNYCEKVSENPLVSSSFENPLVSSSFENPLVSSSFEKTLVDD